MRRSVMEDISSSTESSGRHVTTVADMTEATVRPRVAAPWAASARTTSRSETMPSMWRPSSETTSAPSLAVAQLGDGVGQRGLLADGGDVGSLVPQDRCRRSCDPSRRVGRWCPHRVVAALTPAGTDRPQSFSNRWPSRSRFVRRYVVLSACIGGHEGHATRDLDAAARRRPSVLAGLFVSSRMLADAELGEDGRTDAVLAVVDGQPELEVGVDGVEALVLQLVGLQLVGDPDAPPLVAAEVDDDAPSLGGDQRPSPRGAAARSRSAATRTRRR